MTSIKNFLDNIIAPLDALVAEVSTDWFLIQFALMAAAVMAGVLAQVAVRRWVDLVSLTMGWPPVARQLVRAIAANIGTIVFVIATALMRAAMLEATWPSRSYLLGVATSLVLAWIAITLLSSLIRNRFVYQIVAISAWIFAALSILGLLETVTRLLDSAAIVLGGLRISLLLVLKTAVLLLVTLWLAIAVSNFFDRRLRSITDVTPSIQVLISKIIRLALIVLSIVVVLSSVGIDLSALALFSGAVGVGIGFGLQKIVSNLVSGIILLADKSIKPGDVISVGESFGWVDTMGARYTSVVVRDGREILIPNEDLVTQRVINWSHSNDQVRLDVSFGVSYDSDPHRVRAVAVEAAGSVRRVQSDPLPVCHLIKFGDSSLDFLLRFWIRDPGEGITNVRSAVLLALWDVFKREGIAIPYPVRDLQLEKPVRVVVERGHSPQSDVG